MLLIEHLEGRTFDFLYDSFAEDGKFTKEGRDFETVRQYFLDKFSRKEREDKARSTFEGKFDKQELLDSFNKMNCFYERTK